MAESTTRRVFRRFVTAPYAEFDLDVLGRIAQWLFPLKEPYLKDLDHRTSCEIRKSQRLRGLRGSVPLDVGLCNGKIRWNPHPGYQ